MKYLTPIFLVFIFSIGLLLLPSLVTRFAHLGLDDMFLQDLPYYQNFYLSPHQFQETLNQNYAEFGYETEKRPFIEFNGFMNLLIGQQEMNGVIKLKNGHLASWRGEPFPEYEMQLIVNGITTLAEKQRQNGHDVLVVTLPNKILDPHVAPDLITSYDQENIDRLLPLLAAKNIPLLDLRQPFINGEMDSTTAFPSSDHHYKMSTGFWAFSEIIRHLQSQGILDATEINSAVLDQNNYDVQLLSTPSLGTEGRRVGQIWAGQLDNLDYFLPKFDTQLTMSSSTTHDTLTGSFADVAYNWQRVQNMPTFPLLKREAYYVRGFSDAQTQTYRNDFAKSHKKVMVIGDSFKKTTSIFMPLLFRDYVELDGRYYESNFDVRQYHQDYNPDLVVIMFYYPNGAFDTLRGWI